MSSDIAELEAAVPQNEIVGDRYGSGEYEGDRPLTARQETALLKRNSV